jgi:hypothetical protein
VTVPPPLWNGLPYWGQRQYREAPPFDKAAAEALAPIESAGAEALARARVHETRCPNNHRLAAVYGTRHGLVVAGKGALLLVSLERSGGDSVPGPDGEWVSHDWHVERRNVRGKFRAAPLRVFLGTQLGDGSPAIYVVQCRCRTADLYGISISIAIERGVKKEIYYGEHTREGRSGLAGPANRRR